MYPYPTYIYPDGTKSYNKPRDGEIFHVLKNGSVDSSWQYDDMMAKWVNITKRSPQNVAYHYSYDSDNDPYPHSYPNTWEIKCECGAESVKHPGHSYWCKKYTGKP